ncbi:hypothetical protein ABOONEI_2482 [Aciduliprofundum boonei T469]|nr:hypothetical protein ABOONEI_2482 [Aciduliprofundum boonei T469]
MDTTGLAVVWDFRNGGNGTTITDASGNGHTGDIQGTGYTWASDSIYMDSSTYINTTNPPAPPTNGTVEIWAEMNQYGSETSSKLFDYNQAGSNAGDFSIGAYSNGTWYVYIYDGSANDWIYFQNMKLNVFYYITVVKDGTTLSLYLNGTFVKSITLPAGLTLGATGPGFSLQDWGSYSGDATYKYFAFWTRALNSTEIQERYNEIENGVNTQSNYASFSFGTWTKLLDSGFSNADLNGKYIQGITTDGQYFYLALGNSGGFQYAHIAKYDLNGTLVKDVYLSNISEIANSGMVSDGDITYHNGTLYFVMDPEGAYTGGWIFELDTNLNYITGKNISADAPAGYGIVEPSTIGYHDGYLWVTWDTQQNGTTVISKYDLNLNKVKDYTLGYEIDNDWHYQGVAWYGDYLFLPIHPHSSPDGIDVYYYNSTSDAFEEVERLSAVTGFGFTDPFGEGATIYLRNESGTLEPYIALVSYGSSTSEADSIAIEAPLQVSGNVTGTIDNVIIGEGESNSSSGGDNNNTNDTNNTNNTGGAGNPTGNNTDELMKFLLEKVKIGDYAVPMWVLVVVAMLFLLVILRRR